MSYIEKEKLIKADLASIGNVVRHAFNQGYELGLKDGKERTKPLEQEPCEWIPVSESLPEENETVTASTDYGVYPEARYSKEYGWEWAYEAGSDYWVKLKGVKAWMPLPPVYEGD